jgi:hypothetical protein
VQLSEDIAGYIAFVSSGKYWSSSQGIPRQRFYQASRFPTKQDLETGSIWLLCTTWISSTVYIYVVHAPRLVAGDGSVTSVQDWRSRRGQVLPDRFQGCVVSLQGQAFLPCFSLDLFRYHVLFGFFLVCNCWFSSSLLRISYLPRDSITWFSLSFRASHESQMNTYVLFMSPVQD